MYYIYRIYCNDTRIKNCYIGVSNNIYQRIKQHIHICNNMYHRAYNNKLYQFIRQTGGWDNWDYSILLQIDNDIDKKELHKLERLFYEQYKDDILNTNKPYRTSLDYYNENVKNNKLYCGCCNKSYGKNYYDYHVCDITNS